MRLAALAGPAGEPAGPVDVPDGRECATEPPPWRAPGRRGWRSILINNPASCQPEPAAAAQPAIENAIPSLRYLTSFSNGRRPGPCGDFGSCGRSAGASSCSIASHNALNSESAMRLSFIRSSRIATDTNWAVSRWALSIRPARHCSSVARIKCNRSSELATSVSSDAELTRGGVFGPFVGFKQGSINSGYPPNRVMEFVRRRLVERMTCRSVAQMSDLMIAMESIDQGRQADRPARKSGHHDTATAPLHQRGERLARIA